MQRCQKDPWKHFFSALKKMDANWSLSGTIRSVAISVMLKRVHLLEKDNQLYLLMKGMLKEFQLPSTN